MSTLFLIVVGGERRPALRDVTLHATMAAMESPAEKVLRICGWPERSAVLCGFERFRGMDASRQTSANLVKILLPFLQDEGDTYLNCGFMCVLLHVSGKLSTRDELFYAETRGGIWNMTIMRRHPWVEVHTLREVLQIIDAEHTIGSSDSRETLEISRKGTVKLLKKDCG